MTTFEWSISGHLTARSSDDIERPTSISLVSHSIVLTEAMVVDASGTTSMDK